jgi:hypothetical protein
MTQSTAVATVPQTTGAELAPMSVQNLMIQVQTIQEVMRNVMQEGQHFGKVPGCGEKPSLLKPGAEKLAFVFRLNPEFAISQEDLPGGHRTYTVTCTMKQIGSGHTLGQGVGVCSTLEAKYRFRTGPKQSTGKPVPKGYWDLRKSDPTKAQELIGGKGFSTAKDANGVWEIVIQGEKVEHDNPADHYNTVLKMAKKRAQVDATLTCTAASDIFTQDLEDIRENLQAHQIVSEAPRVESVQNGSQPGRQAPQEAPTGATQSNTAPAASAPQNGQKLDWREVVLPSFMRPIGGMTLGEAVEQRRENAAWWGKNFVPKEYPAGSGKVSTKDQALRDALDAMMADTFADGEEHTPRTSSRQAQPAGAGRPV